jgi:selenocysteine-specific elongation factor
LPEEGPTPLTVGTAGHIDHGKTALVRALTGRDTDRLAEERRRGMSIELGFAELELDDRRLSLVDVPGHERFVRTMIAGASGIDMFLLVVAADDGPMPQTREHLAVLAALGVGIGVVALSKIDLVDRETRLLAAEECRRLLPEAPLVEVSARTDEGIDALRRRLGETAAGLDGSRRTGVADDPVLHVDRCFTVAGHGTVVTGTLWSGRLARGQHVLLLPPGREARIRSIEVHDRRLEAVGPRRRVALNLGGLRRDEVSRGDVVTSPGSNVLATYRLDVELAPGAEAIAAERRVQVHLGTREAPARVADLGAGAIQLRLERPLLARRGDRLVVPRIAPPDTLGGGVVRLAAPPRHGPGWTPPPDRPGGKERPASRPRASAPASEPSPFARRLLHELERQGDRPAGAAQLAAALGRERREVEHGLAELVAHGVAVRLKPDVFYPLAAYERLRQRILALVAAQGSTSIGEVRDALGLSRKYAQALLERLDGERVLRRDGDRHHLGRRGRDIS